MNQHFCYDTLHNLLVACDKRHTRVSSNMTRTGAFPQLRSIVLLHFSITETIEEFNKVNHAVTSLRTAFPWQGVLACGGRLQPWGKTLEA